MYWTPGRPLKETRLFFLIKRVREIAFYNCFVSYIQPDSSKQLPENRHLIAANCVLEALTPLPVGGVKRLKRQAENSPPCSAEVKMHVISPLPTPSWQGAQLSTGTPALST